MKFSKERVLLHSGVGGFSHLKEFFPPLTADEGSFLMEKSVVKSILRRLYGLEGCSCYREGFSEECHSMVYITDKRERF